jgi:hypothetical protein
MKIITDDSGEGLNVARGRSENGGKGTGKNHGSKSRPKGDNGGKFKCYYCQDRVTLRRTILREGAVVIHLLRLLSVRRKAMRVREHS